jgi:hypothetical protein
MVSEDKSYPLGVWAYYADGSIRDYEHADSNAIGVAVVTANCGFVIDKLMTNGNSTINFGGNVNLSGTGVMITGSQSQAKQDFDGEGNTTKLISVISGNYAVNVCRSAFGGKGYLGSEGEWNEAYANKSAVNSMMTKIRGASIYASYHWTSTLYNSSSSTWIYSWNTANTYGDGRTSFYRVRAFKAL